MAKRKIESSKLFLGWREWVSLPELGIPVIRAKVDTGAQTSALHAEDIRVIRRKGRGQRAYFKVRTLVIPSKKLKLEVRCSAEVLGQRVVIDSGGHREERWVIETPLVIGKESWPIEITLTRRDGMRFPMLLGRQALGRKCTIAPWKSFQTGLDLLDSWKKRR